MRSETAHGVTVVIPNYNGRRHLERLLPSIASQTCSDYEVIIIDDRSPDRLAVEYIRAFIEGRPNMRLVENAENLGFVKTCNQGFRMARSSYVCLLTNDTAVSSDFLEKHVATMDSDPTIGILACVVVDPSGNIWFSGGMFRAGMRTNLQDDFDGMRQIDWVAGTAPFYRREVFDRIGHLSEDFVMYHEDIDFCLRLTSETDYRICVLADRLVTHFVQTGNSGGLDLAKVDRLRYYGHRNHILLLRKHCPRYLPKLLLHNLWEIASLLTIGAFVVPLVKLRPRAFLLAIRMAILTVAGVCAGLTARQGRLG